MPTLIYSFPAGSGIRTQSSVCSPGAPASNGGPQKTVARSTTSNGAKLRPVKPRILIFPSPYAPGLPPRSVTLGSEPQAAVLCAETCSTACLAARDGRRKRPTVKRRTHRARSIPVGAPSDDRLKVTFNLKESPLPTSYGPLRPPRARWPWWPSPPRIKRARA